MLLPPGSGRRFRTSGRRSRSRTACPTFSSAMPDAGSRVLDPASSEGRLHRAADRRHSRRRRHVEAIDHRRRRRPRPARRRVSACSSPQPPDRIGDRPRERRRRPFVQPRRRQGHRRASPTCAAAISTATAITISPSPASATTMGETLWLENHGGWTLRAARLQRLSGAINAIVADLNRDGRLDIVALVSQEWEEIWVFVNDGGGQFTPKLMWGSTNADFGSSWIALVDLDRDGDPDILYSNGDAFDYAPANSRPWHGVQWLENTRRAQFDFHRIARSVRRVEPAGGRRRRRRRSRRGGGQRLQQRGTIRRRSASSGWRTTAASSSRCTRSRASPTHLITLAVGDLDGDGAPDLVTGGMHISAPVRSDVEGDAVEESWRDTVSESRIACAGLGAGGSGLAGSGQFPPAEPRAPSLSPELAPRRRCYQCARCHTSSRRRRV